MTSKFRIITLGCKVNQYESAYIAAALARAGWEEAEAGEVAQVVVVNTCIVTGVAQRQSRQAIRKAIRENPGARVAATGCYAQVYGSELTRISGLQVIVDNLGKADLPRILRESEGASRVVSIRPFKLRTPFRPMPIQTFPGRSRAFLKIQDGCEAHCSYCIVPYARGPFRSLQPREVLHALMAMAHRGFREVVLTGIHLGKYGVDLGGATDLLHLLRMILREDLPLRVRLSSLEPGEITAPLVDLVAGEKGLCKHFHIPLQSGDDGVLRRMNRHYKAEEFGAVVRAIRDAIPLAGIGVDVMAGFPGEDERAHANTLALLADLPVTYLHVFPYSQREGTPAARLGGQVASALKKGRAAALRKLGEAKKRAFHEACRGKVFPVLVEREVRARVRQAEGTSENYLTIRFPCQKAEIGELVSVRTERWVRGRLQGAAVLEENPGRGLLPGEMHLTPGP